jgi:formylglycine-generating enzyme required for sulfatase activity
MTNMFDITTGGIRPADTKSAVLAILLLVAIALPLLSPPESSAQTPGLNLQLYAGLSITGAVGTVYSVEYVTDLAQTNSWRSLEFLQLPASPYLWADKSAPATGQRFYRAVMYATPTNLVFIPPGTFRMGSPTNEEDSSILGQEYPQKSVTISRGFWMGKYEVTQGEYLAVMGSNPSHFPGDTNRPVEMVSWFNATNYCGKITQRDRASGTIATNSVYRLPTEAEWEYACRGWTSTRFSYGDDLAYTNLANYAWYADDSGATTHPVGEKLPNPWGLYDTSGNVWEWCLDWYAPYPGGIALDPQGPTTGVNRVFRGGSWFGPGYGSRSAQRLSNLSTTTFDNLGFRVVLSPGQP